MQVVFRMSAIVAALAISAGTLLTACGQRGPLYLPAAPPIPPRPASMQPLPASSAVAPASAPSVNTGDVPDTSGEALSLSPDENLKPSASIPASAAAPKAASAGY